MTTNVDWGRPVATHGESREQVKQSLVATNMAMAEEANAEELESMPAVAAAEARRILLQHCERNAESVVDGVMAGMARSAGRLN